MNRFFRVSDSPVFWDEEVHLHRPERPRRSVHAKCECAEMKLHKRTNAPPKNICAQLFVVNYMFAALDLKPLLVFRYTAEFDL